MGQAAKSLPCSMSTLVLQPHPMTTWFLSLSLVYLVHLPCPMSTWFFSLFLARLAI